MSIFRKSPRRLVNFDESTCFHHEFLDDESVKCNSNEYFKQVSHIVDLEELYQVVGTCYYNDQMNYYPVLLKIANEEIGEKLQGAKYLLQVWSRDSLKVFEEPLQQPPQAWGISFNYFMYLEKGQEAIIKVVRLSDILYIAHNDQDLLYCANSNEIRVLRLHDDAFSSEVDAAQLGMRTVTTDWKIHGLYLDDYSKGEGSIIVAQEGYDNQLDFSLFRANNVEDSKTFNYAFVQYREKNYRGSQMLNDPIKKVCVVFSYNTNFSLSQLESGSFDLYVDMVRKESPKDTYVIDIQMSIYTFYFKTTDYKVLKLDHNNKQTIRFESASEESDYNFDWDKIHLKVLKNTVKLYSAIHIDGVDYNAVICHGQFMSIYDLINFRWKGHIAFEDQIRHMFWIQYDKLMISVLLNNGLVYTLDFSKQSNGIPEYNQACKIDGQVIRFHYDRIARWPLFFTVFEDEVYKLKIITHNAKIQDLGITSENSNLNAINFRVKEADQVFKFLTLVQDGSKLTIYNQIKDGDDGTLTFNIHQILGDFEDITGLIHSVMTYNVQKYLMLFDRENAYLLKLLPQKFLKFEKIYCISCLNDGYTGNFAICQETQDSKYQGFRYLDLQASVDQEKCSLLPLADAEIGALGFIEWGLNRSRWGFISSLRSFIITQYGDRVQNKFFNEKGYDNMYFYRQIQDKFITFYRDKKLYTWDVVTGKVLSAIDIKGYDDIDDFERFNPRGFQSTIYYSKNPVEDGQEKYEDFYLPWQLESGFDNHISFRVEQKKKNPLHIFRDYEIESEHSIKINVEFVFPYNENSYININKAKDRMVAKDKDKLVQIYRAEKIPGKPDYCVKWQIIRAIQEFPQDLHIYYRYRLDFFSPDYSKFINIDSKDKSFYIQDTYTCQVLSRIPKDLVTLKDDQLPFMTICRMMWTDNRTLRIANEDGCEKLVDVEDDYKIIAHNQIPLFNQISGKEWYQMYHIYLSREGCNDDGVKLMRLYQNYKSYYYLKPENAPIKKSDFYQQMFQFDEEFYDAYNHSFSMLQWQLTEKLKSGQLKIDEISDPIIRELIYAIFPGGNTILHYLTDQPEELCRLLAICHPDGKIKHHMPLLPNFQRKTPIHLCMERNSLKSLNALLGVLKLYEPDHHSRAIRDCFNYILKNQIPEFADYIESRFLQTPQLEAFQKGTLQEDSDGMTVSTPWLNEQEFRDNCLEKVQFERKIKLEILDIAVYHYNDPVFDEFFDELAGCDNVSYFELRSLQTIIDFNFGLVQEYLFKKLFIPFCVFQCIYFIWINYIYEDRFQEGGNIYYWVLMVLNVLFATYFLQNEVRQFFSEGFNYLSSGWNYIDLIPPIGIYIISVTSLIEYFESDQSKFTREADELVKATEQATQSGVTGDDIAIEAGKIVSDNAAYQLALERQLVAITTLFMWFKFLYFFRIFQPTAYLIRMIVTVIVGMKYFLLMLLVTIIGFGNAFLVISMGNVASENEEENKRFIGGFIESMLFAYRMVLGDFDTTQFGEVGLPLVYFFFLSFTVFNMIVMLNLLIAIISDSYASVVENAEQASFQEKASMIAENSYLIPKNARENYAAEGQFILVATDLETEEKPLGQDAVIQGIKTVESKLRARLQEIQQQALANQNKVDKSIDELKVFIIKNMPQQIVQTKVHVNRLARMTLFSVRQLYDGAYPEWKCQGFKFTGCQSMRQSDQHDENSTRRTDPKEHFHHCEQCGFDMCETCHKVYGDIHCHKMEILTFEEIQARSPNYSNGWGCDCRLFNGCHLNGKKHTDEYSVLFHDQETKFDLCEKCAYFYNS